MKARILIADDHEIMRQGLRTLLEKNRGLEVVGEAANGREAVRLAAELSPTIVLMDLTMPDMNGIEATRRILKENENLRVIVLSMHADRQFVSESLKAGASGYLLKNCAYDELIRAIEAISRGQTFLSPQIAGVLVEDYRTRLGAPAIAADSPLSEREREVLQLMAEGKSTKEIAAALHISVKTIETHRQQIMRKLKMRSVADLTKYAIRHGLTSL
ncbi:MAG TPA: response regulator transcription factor [Candidatus Sumerlaeota bacterium]|nr:MAG: Oxygen regulatory protein NreC [candidate division BRC1 bacterium ADurb.BinA292]HOE95927.1 response regulator transcription factor [Candidatus Sumerlaeota bacterium]HOR28209.1 response regulator transcription factor [Candidatus Sumerlaeota bacterium]HPK03075.1 response regulator transcription factor [Candidatus Sumerlaeota bacterium]